MIAAVINAVTYPGYSHSFMVLNVEDLGIFAPPLGLTPGVLASGMYRKPEPPTAPVFLLSPAKNNLKKQ